MSAPTSYAYQWKSGSSNATGPGATTETYTTVTADIGNTITCIVTGTNSAGSGNATADGTSAVRFPIGVSMGTTAALQALSDHGLAQYQAMKTAGFYGVRVDVPYNSDNQDPTIQAAITAGLDVIILCDNYNVSSTTASQFATFCGTMATKYGAQGLHHYEIVNEPNIATNWNPGSNYVNPAAYATLMGMCYTAIKAADPLAVVILGGTAVASDVNGASAGSGNYTSSLLPATFLTYMYAQIGGNSTGYWDAVAIHPYAAPSTSNNWGVFLNPVGEAGFYGDSMYAVMSANGDAGKPIWITETGDETPPDSTSGQSTFFTSSITGAQALSGAASTPRVVALYCFNWYDDADGTWGLNTSTFTAKPALAAVEAFLP